jgi:hypothetical protein
MCVRNLPMFSPMVAGSQSSARKTSLPRRISPTGCKATLILSLRESIRAAAIRYPQVSVAILTIEPKGATSTAPKTSPSASKTSLFRRPQFTTSPSSASKTSPCASKTSPSAPKTSLLESVVVAFQSHVRAKPPHVRPKPPYPWSPDAGFPAREREI